jgi:hypothetical protein
MWTQFWTKTRKTTLTEAVPRQNFSAKLCRGRKIAKQGVVAGLGADAAALGADASGGCCVGAPQIGAVAWLRANAGGATPRSLPCTGPDRLAPMSGEERSGERYRPDKTRPMSGEERSGAMV